MNYYVKAIWVGAIAFLGPIAGALVDPLTGFGDLSAGVWVASLAALLFASGGVLGLQRAPASVSTGIKNT